VHGEVMKEEALKLADFMNKHMVEFGLILGEVSRDNIVGTIRKLVEEIDCLKLTAQHHEFMARHLGMIAKEKQELLDKVTKSHVELEKGILNSFKQEPVAWIDPKELNMDVSTTVTKNKQFDGDIPLYTAPRELSDEEINKLWAESNEDGIAMQQGFTTQQHYFAHLILKKASEK
jgi:hypothetical protein